MLILTRKSGESILIGERVTVTILAVNGTQVKVGVDAPKEVSIYRLEVYERIRRENKTAADIRPEDLTGLEQMLPVKSEKNR